MISGGFRKLLLVIVHVIVILYFDTDIWSFPLLEVPVLGAVRVYTAAIFIHSLISHLWQSVHLIGVAPVTSYSLVLLEELTGQAHCRCSLEVRLLHTLGEDILNLLLCHRVDLNLEVFGQAEGLNLEIFALADEFVDLTHASQSDLLPSFLGQAREFILATGKETLVVED